MGRCGKLHHSGRVHYRVPPSQGTGTSGRLTGQRRHIRLSGHLPSNARGCSTGTFSGTVSSTLTGTGIINAPPATTERHGRAGTRARGRVSLPTHRVSGRRLGFRRVSGSRLVRPSVIPDGGWRTPSVSDARTRCVADARRSPDAPFGFRPRRRRARRIDGHSPQMLARAAWAIVFRSVAVIRPTRDTRRAVSRTTDRVVLRDDAETPL